MALKACVMTGLVITLGVTAPAPADVVIYRDRAEWIEAAGAFDTVDFVGYPAGTLLHEQYAHLGVHFIDGDDRVHLSKNLYPNDGAGGTEGLVIIGIRLAFDADMHAIAIDFPGLRVIRLFRDGEAFYTSPPLSGRANSGEIGNFAGLVSTEPFDAVRLFGSVFDDIHFGPPITTCHGDLNRDRDVGFDDLLAILDAWGKEEGPEDLDGNGVVDFEDLVLLLSLWGPCD
jgi:hypothetical protein